VKYFDGDKALHESGVWKWEPKVGDFCRHDGGAVAVITHVGGATFNLHMPDGPWSFVPFEECTPIRTESHCRAWLNGRGFVVEHHSYPAGISQVTVRNGAGVGLLERSATGEDSARHALVKACNAVAEKEE